MVREPDAQAGRGGAKPTQAIVRRRSARLPCDESSRDLSLDPISLRWCPPAQRRQTGAGLEIGELRERYCLMADTLTKEQRSAQMALVKGKDTRPEMIVRRALHALGYRFRLHRRDLPGTPDIVLPGRRAVVLVHGCFWHGHAECPRSRIPKTKADYWVAKIKRNRSRDAIAVRELETLGWTVHIVWECETRNTSQLKQRLVSALGLLTSDDEAVSWAPSNQAKGH